MKAERALSLEIAIPQAAALHDQEITHKLNRAGRQVRQQFLALLPYPAFRLGNDSRRKRFGGQCPQMFMFRRICYVQVTRKYVVIGFRNVLTGKVA